MKFYDVIIIGGGVVGCLTARALSRYNLRILLIEKEADIGMGASSANSAIIHAGHDPVPGTLKALLNVRANPMWDALAHELDVPFKRNGAYVVAVGAEQFTALDGLLQRGKQNGVPCEIISRDDMLHREPRLNPDVTGALFTPTAGVVDTFNITVAAAENAIQNGVEVLLDTRFEDFLWEGDEIAGVKTSRGSFCSRWVVNAAGMYCDDVMHKAGIRPEFNITPRRGEYYVLDQADFYTDQVFFPVPSSTSKGILVLASTHGNVLVGPNSQPVENKADASVTHSGLEEIWNGARQLIPELNPRHIIATFAGLRATGNAPSQTPGVDYSHDFIVEIPANRRGLVNLGGIESPGLTSAPAIAEMVVDLLKDAGLMLTERDGWNPLRSARPRFSALSRAEQAELIHRDPRYGRVVCRCEMVTEGEIVAAIHAPLPAHTYDAIKRRTWLGTGRCLGSFDMPRVVDILARELGVSPCEITKKGAGSEFLVRRTKDVEVQHDA